MGQTAQLPHKCPDRQLRSRRPTMSCTTKMRARCWLPCGPSCCFAAARQLLGRYDCIVVAV